MTEVLRKTVLIVDDDDGMRTMLAALLSDRYRCFTAESAEQAIGTLEGTHVDLVLAVPATGPFSPDDWAAARGWRTMGLRSTASVALLRQAIGPAAFVATAPIIDRADERGGFRTSVPTFLRLSRAGR